MFFRDLQRIVPLLLFMAALPLCAATVTTYDGVDIDLDHSSAESLATIEELRALDRQIVSLFRVSGRRLPLKCRIVISGELPPGELLVELKPREWTLSFNDRGGRWLTDFALRRRLAGMLILSKVPLAEAPAHPDYLPGWIIAGIDERMRAGRESELMLRRNRYMPVLRALSERGTFPDFRQLRNLTPELLTPPARAWYGELGRALLDYGAVCSTPTDNALLDYCILSAKPGSIENQSFLATLGRVFLKDAAKNGLPEHTGREIWDKLSDDEKIQRTLEAYARRLAFNDFFPQPVPITSAAFEALNKLELPVLDEHGLPTGEHTSADLFDLPEIIQQRADAAALQQELRLRILALGEGNDGPFNRLLQDLADALMRLPLTPPARPEPPPSSGERFRQAIARIRNDLERRAKIEAFLDAVEMENRIPADFYRDAIREANRPSPLLTEREEKFLERVEREWLDD